MGKSTSSDKFIRKHLIGFVLHNGTIRILFDKNINHYKWLVESNIVTESEFCNLTLGHIGKDKVYFYASNYKTNSKVEQDAKRAILTLDDVFNLEHIKYYYCGIENMKREEQCTPIKTIRYREF